MSNRYSASQILIMILYCLELLFDVNYRTALNRFFCINNQSGHLIGILKENKFRIVNRERKFSVQEKREG